MKASHGYKVAFNTVDKTITSKLTAPIESWDDLKRLHDDIKQQAGAASQISRIAKSAAAKG